MTAMMRERIDAARVRDAARPFELGEADLIRRAMALRKQKRIGILWAEAGKYYVSESEFDPWGTRWPITLTELRVMVEAAELERKPVECELRRGENSLERCNPRNDRNGMRKGII